LRHKLVSWFIRISNIVYFFAGQDDIPTCFASGECTNSLELYSWKVKTLSECLSNCEEAEDCEFFNYFVTGGLRNDCKGLANCGKYSSDSCVDCTIGKRTCRGENAMY